MNCLLRCRPATPQFHIHPCPRIVLLSSSLYSQPFRFASSVTTTPSPPLSSPSLDHSVENVTSVPVDSTSLLLAHHDLSLNTLHHIGDLKLAGLASNWTPVGWVQQALEAIHVSIGLPWWSSIVVVTIILRAGLTPLMIKLQHTSAIMFNLRPQTESINAKMAKAKESNNQELLHQCATDLQLIYRRAGVNPLSALAMPLIQAPIMISFFMAIRKIAEAGLPSFQSGGLLWFTDLSLPDPTYALPVIASASFLATIQINAETGVSSPQGYKMKAFFQFATVAAIPFTAAMPSGIFVYWLTSSTWTLVQAILLKRPEIRKLLNLPLLLKPTPNPKDPPKEMGFIESFKMSYKAGREAGVQLDNTSSLPVEKTLAKSETSIVKKNKKTRANQNGRKMRV